jgi:hypothetical protein
MDQHRDLRIQLGPLFIDPRIVIYATLIQMTAYAFYDEPGLTMSPDVYLELFWIGVIPMIAIASAHAFSESLDVQIRSHRRLNWHDRRTIFVANMQFIYVALLPATLLLVLWFFDWEANNAVNLVIELGALSLLFWGAFTARAAGLSRWRWLTFGLSYASLGLVVVLLEILLGHQ